ncbi:MAG: hypothetical protein E5V99_30315 [Mesorhizobium sp.]|nr:MAG: hypothetical protein E5V99_30315 [Mesorhizobium sp.]
MQRTSEHTIKLTDEQLGLIGAAVAELPFRLAQPLLAAIQDQLSAAASQSEDASAPNSLHANQKDPNP